MLAEMKRKMFIVFSVASVSKVTRSFWCAGSTVNTLMRVNSGRFS